MRERLHTACSLPNGLPDFDRMHPGRAASDSVTAQERAGDSEDETMMANIMIPMATMLMLVLGGLPAAADHRERDRREPKLEKVAHKLSRAANELYRDANRSRRFHRGWNQRAALNGFERLNDHACAFEERLARRGWYAPSTQAAYHRLLRAHDTAVRRLDRVDRRHRLNDEMARVSHLIQRLETRVARLERRDRRDRYAGWERHRGWRGTFAWNY